MFKTYFSTAPGPYQETEQKGKGGTYIFHLLPKIATLNKVKIYLNQGYLMFL